MALSSIRLCLLNKITFYRYKRFIISTFFPVIKCKNFYGDYSPKSSRWLKSIDEDVSDTKL